MHVGSCFAMEKLPATRLFVSAIPRSAFLILPLPNGPMELHRLGIHGSYRSAARLGVVLSNLAM